MTKYLKTLSLSALAAALTLTTALPASAASLNATKVVDWEKTGPSEIKVEDQWGRFYKVGIEEGCELLDGGHRLGFRADSGTTIRGVRQDRIRSGNESCRITSVERLKG